MTESDWLKSTDPQAMLRLAAGRISRCCGCVWCDNLDLTVSLATGQKACPRCDNGIPSEGYREIASDRKLRLFGYAWRWAADIPTAAADELEDRNLESVQQFHGSAAKWALSLTKLKSVSQTTQAAILHSIVGNPWRTYAWSRYHDASPSGHELQFLDERWRTHTVRTLAEATYSERLRDGQLNPDRLGILADALEDAGCTDAEILGQLRSSGPFYRGMWALDLILGLE